MNLWTILQLADSAWPSGSFAHSAGLESAWRGRLVHDERSLESFLHTQLAQWARGTAPLALMAFRDAAEFPAADALCDLFLNHPVANQASRVQGRGMLAAALRAWPDAGLSELDDRLRASDSPRHFAPIFGAISARLAISEPDAARLLCFTTLRGVISAAVRLNIIGPLAAQAMQHRLTARAEAMAGESRHVSPDDIAQTSPVADLLSSCHGRLYSRLFQS